MLPRSFSHKFSARKKTGLRYIITGIFLFLLIFLASTFFVQEPVFAQDTFGLQPVDDEIVLESQDIRVTIARIIRVFLGLLGVIALSIVMYGGFLIMTSAGNDEKVARGRQTIINGVIGLIIIMSAFAITQFIINALSEATGLRGPSGGSGQAPLITTFNGSGGLGNILRDHYPFRDQTGVKRNTKIMVTFAEAIDPASIITDTNGSGTLGDCVTATGAAFDWRTDCDMLNTNAVQIFPSDNDSAIVEAAALTTYEGADNEAFSFVFKPLDLLGSATEDIWYTVELTSDVLKADGVTSAFIDDRDGRYFWEFQTDQTLDFNPPYITSVLPVANGDGVRNSIIQIRFNEAVDPITVQGLLGPGTNFSNIIFHDPNVTGEWKVTNGYKTVEFVSDQPCGQNSCGETMYCMPIFTCPVDDTSCREPYQVLVRTADLIATTTFEALPFTGVTDVAGNALDGDRDGVPDGKPSIGDASVIDGGEAAPDNYTWNFNIQNTIDRTAPHIEQVFPALDQESVTGNQPVEIRFSKPMWENTLYNVKIEEHPANTAGLPSLWFAPTADVTSTATGFKTIVNYRHREFGPNGHALYYFTEVPSEVRGLNQNCLYPGRGPISPVKNVSPVCTYEVGLDGTVITDENCAPVTMTSSTDTACVQTTNSNEVLQADTEACLNYLRSVSTAAVTSSNP